VDGDIHPVPHLLTISVDEGNSVEDIGNILFVCNSGSYRLNGGCFPLEPRTLPANTLKSLKIIGINGCDIFTAKDSDFEILYSCGQGSTRLDEVGKSLVNDSIGTNVFSNFLLSTVESNQFFCVREVNTIDVGIPTKGLAIE